MLCRLLALLPAIGAALRVLGFRRTRDLLEYASRPRAIASSDNAGEMSDIAQRIARLVAIASRHGPYGATCLRQSLALWWLLRRRGMGAELRIGVRKDGPELRAHAWVEHEGRSLGQPIPGFAPFTDLQVEKRGHHSADLDQYRDQTSRAGTSLQSCRKAESCVR